MRRLVALPLLLAAATALAPATPASAKPYPVCLADTYEFGRICFEW